MKQLKTILIISLTLIAINLFGQNQLIILKDSTLIHGEVLNSDKYNIMVKVNNEVKRINKNEILDIYKAKYIVRNFDNNAPSYFNISDIGMLSGKRDGYKKYSFSFNMINGIQLDERISAGLGFGIEFMDIHLIPLFGDLRWNLHKGKTQVFIGMQGGFAFPLERNMVWDDYNYNRGYFYNPVIGLKANFNKSRNAFVITCGFRHMNIMGERWDDWWLETKYEREFIYDRFSFRVGYYFN